MSTPLLGHAQTMWNYLCSFSQPRPAEVVIVCCSYDLRVCEYACSLLAQGCSAKVLFSGRSGHWTRHLFESAEAQVFAAHARSLGVNAGQILVESMATNLGENVAHSLQMVPDARSVLFVSKPNTILRVKLTVPVHAPELTYSVACPEHVFPDEVSPVVGLFGLVSEMVGDIERIKRYPELGFQVPHTLPVEVVEAQQALLALGFDHHMP